MPDLSSLQSEAAAEGRHCLAGALILDESGRVFVHRRGWERKLLPGCWDAVGGHVEPGESLLQALEREIAEETGWQLLRTRALAYVGDWSTNEGGVPINRREFDFVVEVGGDLARPQLEVPKHTEFRWLGPEDLGQLEKNHNRDGGMVHHLVELGVRYGAPGRRGEAHLIAFVAVEVAAPIERIRASWDPAMAAQVAAHVTVIYPQEISGVDNLVRHARDAASGIAPFRLRLGGVRHNQGWVYVEVDDVDGSWTQLRERALDPVVDPVEPHVTLVHPRTTNRGTAAGSVLSGGGLDVCFTVRELVIIVFDGNVWRAFERIPLRR